MTREERRFTDASIPPDEFAPNVQGWLGHRHKAGMPCAACLIQRQASELADLRARLAALQGQLEQAVIKLRIALDIEDENDRPSLVELIERATDDWSAECDRASFAEIACARLTAEHEALKHNAIVRLSKWTNHLRSCARYTDTGFDCDCGLQDTLLEVDPRPAASPPVPERPATFVLNPTPVVWRNQHGTRVHLFDDGTQVSHPSNERCELCAAPERPEPWQIIASDRALLHAIDQQLSQWRETRTPNPVSFLTDLHVWLKANLAATEPAPERPAP